MLKKPIQEPSDWAGDPIQNEKKQQQNFSSNSYHGFCLFVSDVKFKYSLRVLEYSYLFSYSRTIKYTINRRSNKNWVLEFMDSIVFHFSKFFDWQKLQKSLKF